MTRVRLVTWNIHACIGRDRRYDPARTASVLRTLDADVIGLQEVDWRHPNRNGLDQLAELADRLGMTPIEGPNLEDHRGSYGNAILTRLPIERTRELDLAIPEREPRGAIDASLSLGGRSLRVLVTHLGLSRRERWEQAARIDRHLRAEPRPRDQILALLGDLNEWRPGSRGPWRSLRAQFDCSCAPRTFPVRRPTLRLDRVLIAPAPHRFEGEAVRTRAARLASDHLPVCVEAAWR